MPIKKYHDGFPLLKKLLFCVAGMWILLNPQANYANDKFHIPRPPPLPKPLIQADIGVKMAHRPIVERASNGVPVVQISKPSAQGISRNRYQRFSVGRQGAVFNNSIKRTSTRLADSIHGNPLLDGRSAKVIVNEVTGRTSSHLLGALEVAGPKADVVLSNPNGISCDGCGFIHTTRATLSTGIPIWRPKGLQGFDVAEGLIRVGQKGLHAKDIEQLDLLARGLVVAGDVEANHLRAVLGQTTVDMDGLISKRKA